MLTLYAGETARRTLLEHGLKPELFTAMLGASGGPKWFTLFGLDKYLFGEFFKHRTTPLDIIGSSAGAFRAACFAQSDPVAAIERLAKHHSETTYSDKVTPAEITHKARELLVQVLGTDGVDDIIANPVFRAHFIVARVNGLAASEKKLSQMLGLTKSLVANRMHRRFISRQYTRVVFKNPLSALEIADSYQFPTEHIPLTPNNLTEALLASGSIPLVMQGIRDIPGAPMGMYRDGGIIDYHFDIDFPSNQGLILYPHFSHAPKAGWFDKSLKRPINPKHYDRVVMLVPSREFVASLPYGKIPDREDFTKMKAEQRLRYWSTVFDETEKLADDFAKWQSNIQLRPMLSF
ncbi:patatin-like phospholipase family protein [Alteromonas oceanisediminis]|uniref:patatin-like phospholipase family protein n=1 Tax=Alteromonas oceanisediminis TaxID=2836180 RepID=UPI001BDAF6DF|nr:patatin-like phospholipase family protein [Alteromonas oceanisediminis]MBT0587293.1 patatin-like phospholipase family protein [Alteromonas oceanisediminis]